MKKMERYFWIAVLLIGWFCPPISGLVEKKVEAKTPSRFELIDTEKEENLPTRHGVI